MGEGGRGKGGKRRSEVRGPRRGGGRVSRRGKAEGGRGRAEVRGQRAEAGNSSEELTAKARRTQRKDRKMVDKKIRRD